MSKIAKTDSKLPEPIQIDSLKYKAAKVVAPYLTASDSSYIPKEVWKILQFYMKQTKQVEVFNDFRGYWAKDKLQVHTPYKNGKKHGPGIWYYDNGKIWIREYFVDGMLEGHYYEYDEKEKMKVTQHMYYKGGKQNDIYIMNGLPILKG